MIQAFFNTVTNYWYLFFFGYLLILAFVAFRKAYSDGQKMSQNGQKLSQKQ